MIFRELNLELLPFSQGFAINEILKQINPSSITKAGYSSSFIYIQTTYSAGPICLVESVWKDDNDSISCLYKREHRRNRTIGPWKKRVDDTWKIHDFKVEWDVSQKYAD